MEKVETKRNVIDACNKGTSRLWTFTLFHYTEADIQRLKSFDQSVCHYIVFGEELTEEGIPHLQGYVNWADNKRMNATVQLINSEIAKGKVFKSCLKNKENGILYCKKGTQSHEEWETLNVTGPNYGKNAVVHEVFFKPVRSGQGVRNDWREIYEYIKEHPDYSMVLAEYPDQCIRYHAGVKCAIQSIIESAGKADLNKEYENVTLREWQAALLEELQKIPDTRTVVWYTDYKGHSGKTWFARYLVAKHGAAYLENGKSSDLAYAYKGERICIFDFVRTMETKCNYEIIKKIKNGILFSPKYDSKTVVFKNPHVVVFANFAPDLTAMSQDRWSVRYLGEYLYNSVQPMVVVEGNPSPKGECPLPHAGDNIDDYVGKL